MFKPGTVFIVGAGASAEFGFPQGESFKQKISDRLHIRYEGGYKQVSGDMQITQALRTHAANIDGGLGDINPYLYTAWDIINALPAVSSIDSYIEIHNDNEDIELLSKMAITQTILEAEQESPLSISSHNRDEFNLTPLSGTWIANFTKILVQGLPKDKLEDIFSNISFVCFNYDRCIEQFLPLSLKAIYSITDQEAQDLVKNLKIYHPYGFVGDNPWQTGDPYQIYFGRELDWQQLYETRNQIKTFSEQLEEKDTLNEIKTEIVNANTLVFLGMAFHPQNLKILTPDYEECSVQQIYGTAFGISDSDLSIVETQIRKMVDTPKGLLDTLKVELRNDLKCADLFDQYQRNLSKI